MNKRIPPGVLYSTKVWVNRIIPVSKLNLKSIIPLIHTHPDRFWMLRPFSEGDLAELPRFPSFSMPVTLTYPLTALLMIALPIALGIVLERKFRLGWRLWWIGAATFIFSQIGHIPFNIGLTALFNRGVLPTPPQAWVPAFNAVILGLSAGAWEELARFATYRWWAKEARSWRKGVMLGAGHGGIEAILMGILALVNFVYMVAIRNADLTSMVPLDQLAVAQKAIANFWAAPWYDILLGALERAFTIPIHIALSLLVLQMFTRRRPLWLLLAIGWHALADGMVVFTLSIRGIYVAEAMVGVACLLSLVIIFALRQPEPPEEQVQPESAPPQPPRPVDFDKMETPEKLDESRFL